MNYLNEDTCDYNIVNLLPDKYISTSGRLYFTITKDTSDNNNYITGNLLWAYISFKTGKVHALCPDPLCTHTANSTCKYLKLYDLIPDPKRDSKLYALRHEFTNNIGHDVIYELDCENQTIKTLYTIADIAKGGFTYSYIDLYYVNNDELYFSETRVTEREDEQGKKYYDENQKTFVLDLLSEKNIPEEYVSDDKSQSLYVIGNSSLVYNASQRRVSCIDMSTGVENTFFCYEEGYHIYDMYYDDETSEIYLLLCSTDLKNGTEDDLCTDTGCIYVIDKEYKVNTLKMPSNHILDFQLTKDYIYYTKYDPIKYGTTRQGQPTVDETGDKIYRVNRRDIETTEIAEEIVFDGRNELLFNGSFYVFGNYLYLDYYYVKNNGEGTYFYRAGPVARYNMAQNTIFWLDF